MTKQTHSDGLTLIIGATGKTGRRVASRLAQRGVIALPAGDTPEPFVDAALTEPGHAGEVYEVTGPQLMTFADIAASLTQATGRPISYQNIAHEDFVNGLAKSGAPKDVIWMLDYLFSTVLDGRNASMKDGVQRALGRAPKDFDDYARAIAATALWRATA